MKSTLELVDEALEQFDVAGASVASLVRKAVRIATKRRDYLGLIALLPETFDLSVGKVDHAAFADARSNLVALLGKEEGEEQAVAVLMRHEQRRKAGNSGVHGKSIGQLESMLAEYDAVSDGYKSPPANLTPVDTYFVAKDYDAAAAKLLPIRMGLRDVIERTRQFVYDYLLDTERELEAGKERPDVLERGREYVQRSLASLAPEALEIFKAAEHSIVAGSSKEDLAHALTSCRRMIKALADALYPPTGEVIIGLDGQERSMDDDAYRNRLLQFAADRLGASSAHNAMVTESLESLGKRLQRLNELSSKGVHHTVSQIEAETCVVWTYLTVADILRIADGTSAVSRSAQ